MRVELFVMVMRQQLSWNARIFRYFGILKNWPDDQSRFVDHEWGHPRAMRPCSPSKSLFSFGFHIFLARSLFHASRHALKNSTGNLKSLHVFAVYGTSEQMIFILRSIYLVTWYFWPHMRVQSIRALRWLTEWELFDRQYVLTGVICGPVSAVTQPAPGLPVKLGITRQGLGTVNFLELHEHPLNTLPIQEGNCCPNADDVILGCCNGFPKTLEQVGWLSGCFVVRPSEAWLLSKWFQGLSLMIPYFCPAATWLLSMWDRLNIHASNKDMFQELAASSADVVCDTIR